MENYVHQIAYRSRQKARAISKYSEEIARPNNLLRISTEKNVPARKTTTGLTGSDGKTAWDYTRALINSNLPTEREKVPGDNPAYTREKSADQLFDIMEFSVSPYPPIINRRIFFSLGGSTGTRDVPGLTNTSLELRANWSDYKDEPEYRSECKLLRSIFECEERE
ncbi:hypothetical protein K458DRAFT_404527 [Lentithecium fluviatile CBS 122367]|uniref:Uncharacterized protein n=1 Tax=Lentithecium fluviatile CBS 122367 TaxID=1168545 RepID=A0A6G1IZ66_9PLEO|nr:hypothetical protein K458DRAFT_404527 [Lentithecium fluviatile CBS 122367]